MRALALFATWLFALHAFAQEPATPLPVPELPEPSTEEAPAVEELSRSELDALGLNTEGSRVDTDFHFWGFADFTSSLLINPRGAPAVAQGRHHSFYVGNVNLYVSKNLSESFRTMTEVRLTYLPNGSYAVGAGGYEQVDTSAFDYANGQSLTRWGGIILQRAYLEWTLHRFVTVRAGQFLSPFGIWNVDHGSPAYIPSQRPLGIVRGMFPERQTGLEAFGRWNASNDFTVGYHLTLSNGTGPISEYKDLDRNKAVGGRLYGEYFGRTYLRGGASGYYGRETYSSPTATITPTTIDLSDRIDTQSDLLILAADLLLKRGGLRLQAEWILQQRRFTEEGRTVHSVIGGPVSTAASADTFSHIGYALAAYRFAWYGLTPYALIESGNFTLNNQALPDARATMFGWRGGLNVSPIESVVFKLEFAQFRFWKTAALLKDTVNALQVQIAWAF